MQWGDWLWAGRPFSLSEVSKKTNPSVDGKAMSGMLENPRKPWGSEMTLLLDGGER